jgi:hypothetical protein
VADRRRLIGRLHTAPDDIGVHESEQSLKIPALERVN